MTETDETSEACEATYDCPVCRREYTPGGFAVQPMFNAMGDYYLARRCPQCEFIHDRLTLEGELTPRTKKAAIEDPDPPEGWP